LCMALFVRTEFLDAKLATDGRRGFFSARPWTCLMLFVLLGAANMVKGPLLAMLVVMPVVATFLIWDRDRVRIRRYVWFWGWAICGALAAAWPLAAWRTYPDV